MRPSAKRRQSPSGQRPCFRRHPPTRPRWALTFWGELVKVGLLQEVQVCAGAMAHFLQPNPTALRERKHPEDRQDLEGPPRPSVFPEPTRPHSRGTGTGMGKNQRRGICTIPHSEAKLGDKLRIPGTPGPKPVLVTHRPPPHSENTPGVCPGAGPQDRGPLPKSILRLYGTHGALLTLS